MVHNHNLKHHLLSVSTARILRSSHKSLFKHIGSELAHSLSKGTPILKRVLSVTLQRDDALMFLRTAKRHCPEQYGRPFTMVGWMPDNEGLLTHADAAKCTSSSKGPRISLSPYLFPLPLMEDWHLSVTVATIKH